MSQLGVVLWKVTRKEIRTQYIGLQTLVVNLFLDQTIGQTDKVAVAAMNRYQIAKPVSEWIERTI